jgi:nucleoid DNA-binding protein
MRRSSNLCGHTPHDWTLLVFFESDSTLPLPKRNAVNFWLTLILALSTVKPIVGFPVVSQNDRFLSITRRNIFMTKKEIVRTISEEIGLTQLKTNEIVQKMLDAIIHALATDGRIELRNFGVFEVKKRKARQGRNPRTGVKVEVPEKLVVTFKAGKDMEARITQLEDGPISESGYRPNLQRRIDLDQDDENDN